MNENIEALIEALSSVIEKVEDMKPDVGGMRREAEEHLYNARASLRLYQAEQERQEDNL